MSNRQPTYISLFSGCGGFDDGFDQSGFQCKGAFDNDPTVLDVYKQNLLGPAYLHDLSNSNLPLNLEPNTIDVVVSGSPCQGFSTAGLRALDDPRNHLMFVGGKITLELQPKVFVGENVMGSLSGQHKEYWEKLSYMLSSAGYNVRLIKCDARDFGLAQTRKRIIMLAWKGRADVSLDFPKTPFKTLKEVLQGVEGLPSQDLYQPLKGKAKEIVTHILPGQKLCNVRGGDRSVHTWNIPSVFGEVDEKELHVLALIKDIRRKVRIRDNGDADPVPEEHLQAHSVFNVGPTLLSLINKGYIRKVGDKYDLVHSFNGLYRRLEWHNPSMTVDTRFGNPRFFLHPEEMRGFTVREAARIQGFRDSFIFSGSLSKQYKMIGNAVPPPMAFNIATIIKDRLLNE